MTENLSPDEQQSLCDMLVNNVPFNDENLKQRLRDAVLSSPLARSTINVVKLDFKKGHPAFGSSALKLPTMKYLLHPSYINVEAITSLVEGFKNEQR